ncbi:Sad1-interacting factor 3 [Taxawa tesnikishii (nom. ined.)]|nr:Sad1-interacting factor 3 [Dothideales sp. JES 119]
MAANKPKRNPTVLVTDARETPWRQPQRPSTLQRTGTKLISVDNVLQYASEIPSAQRRTLPGPRPVQHSRTPSGRHPLNPRLAGTLVPVTGHHMPSRSSKVSEKLVLLPETTEEGDDEKDEFGEDDEAAPPTDEELARRRLPSMKDKSYAERLPKARRAEKLARVTAYCTAQSTKLARTATFLRDQHGAKTKLYDDCLYCVYQLPLLGGSDGYRVRSSPVLKNPGGRSVLDEQIEANERRQYREGWMEEHESYSVRGNEGHTGNDGTREHERHHGDPPGTPPGRRRESTESTFSWGSPSIAPDATSVAEMFVFSYGVAVFWNFSAHQEKTFSPT